jgi:ATP-dependent protease HslVU (ClpYQ) ATPase subunit
MTTATELSQIDFDSDDAIPVYNKEHKELATIANNYIKRLTSGEIDLKQFEIDIAYWYMDFIDRVSYKPLPTESNEVMQYEEELKRQKRGIKRIRTSFDEAEFAEKAMKKEVELYYEERNRIKNINNSNLYWLEEVKKLLPKEDSLNRNKLDMKIIELKSAIQEEEMREDYYQEERY